MQEKVWISGIFDVIFKNHPSYTRKDWLPVGYFYSKPVMGEILEIQWWKQHDDAPSYVVASVFAKLVSVTTWKDRMFLKPEPGNALLELPSGKRIPLLKYTDKFLTRWTYSDELMAELERNRWTNSIGNDMEIRAYPQDNIGLKKAMETAKEKRAYYAEWLSKQPRRSPPSVHREPAVSNREIEDMFRKG